ncbi:ATP-binding protein [Hymenobacter gummosus]|uniref:ATP-binding protein n=1 Tax=Hymenobacter gummosus TaxID=1776032 RepID=A0A431TVY9_9BACT|nr:ATP-binding protein [Hymenobacter gummosus]RTQ45467.1 ATP-binding protein [Hymenobacter gummosus]
MLIRFTVRNYKSFREAAEWSLLASPDTTREADNVVAVPEFGLRLLRSAVVYGANASGKSKLVQALMFMRDFVRNSSRDTQKGDAIPVEPFRLSTVTEHEPSEFEVVFLHEHTLYRYGFTATTSQIVAEWFYYRPKTKEVELFYRDEQGIRLHKTRFSGIIQSLVTGRNIRENALLLSVAAQFNNAIAVKAFEWFDDKLNGLSGLSSDTYQGYSMSQVLKPDQKQRMLDLLRQADLAILDVEVETVDFEQVSATLPSSLRQKIKEQTKQGNKPIIYSDVRTARLQYDASQQAAGAVLFSLTDDESAGTEKFFYLTGPLLDVLDNGMVFVVDELDSRLHPNLVARIVALFNSRTLNPHNAQLLFNTHNSNLLDNSSFRRDQIWFTEKDVFGASSLYSLSDFTGVRKDGRYEDYYLRGKYGAVPILGDFSHPFTPHESDNAR